MRRDGFTLIEMMMALVILGVVVLGMATATGRFTRVVSDADRGASAIQLVMDRVNLAVLYPDYGVLDSVFTRTETGLPGFPDWTRQTVVNRVQQANVDFTRVTVRVAGPGLADTVSRTIVRGAP